MRDTNIRMFKDTLSICARGYYIRNEETVGLKLSRDQMKTVQLFSPDAIAGIELDPVMESDNPSTSTIRLSDKDSFDAACEMIDSGIVPEGERVLVLNFANPVHPGGGVKNGAKAQEEDLCRKSTLYCSLTSNEAVAYYSYNRHLGDMSSDYMMISPNVEVFRNSEGDLLEDTIVVSVITAAAPILRSGGSECAEEVKTIFEKRICNLLKVAAATGYRFLVLGAWGCGAFGNDAQMVAELFDKAIQQYGNRFTQIEFAVYCTDHDSYNYRAFSTFYGEDRIQGQISQNEDEESMGDKEISPYAESFPIHLFRETIQSSIDDARTVAEDIYKAVLQAAPAASQLSQVAKKGFRLVVNTTDEMLKDIESGKIKLTEENGKTYAQIKNGNLYGPKLEIKREYFRREIDPTQMSTALQLASMQDQIQRIAGQLTVIDQSVREVLQGQQNDRLGLYYSGLTQFLEAREVRDEQLRTFLLSNALKSLSESYHQLMMTMKENISYLQERKYKGVRGSGVELIDAHMSVINQCFGFIHQSALMRAAIYCEQKELTAMSCVLDQYSDFISTVVVNSAGLLAQCDTSDNGTSEGVWKKRAQLRLDVSEASKKLKSPEKTVYLSILHEEE